MLILKPDGTSLVVFFVDVSMGESNLCFVQNSGVVQRSAVDEWGGVFPRIPEKE